MDDTIITLEQFQTSLQQAKEDDAIMHLARKYLLHGTPYVFHADETAYYDFRNLIADHFGISYRDVYIVGSAKLGFSYFKKTQFSLDSDIDVAIVSRSLFESYMKELCEYQYSRKYGVRLTNYQDQLYLEFLSYLAKGWFRPDKLPMLANLKTIRNDWFDYFKTISNGKSQVGNYAVSCGLYKDYFYLEKYILNSFKKIIK